MTPTDADLHAENRIWSGEAALWLEELTAWHQERDAALASLARIELLLHKYAEAESQDRDELAAYTQQLRSHEHAIARFIQGDDDLSREDVRNQHRLLADLREEHRARHQAAKQELLEAVAAFDRLRRTPS